MAGFERDERLDRYIERVRAIPKLSREEEHELAKRAQAGDDKAAEKMRNRCGYQEVDPLSGLLTYSQDGVDDPDSPLAWVCSNGGDPSHYDELAHEVELSTVETPDGLFFEVRALVELPAPLRADAAASFRVPESLLPLDR